MKYVSLPGTGCYVLDTVQSRYGPPRGPASIPHYATVLYPGFMVFRIISNTIPGLVPTKLRSRDMDDGNWYIDPASSVGMTPSC